MDNLDFVKDNQIFETFLIYKRVIQEIEKQEIYKLKNEYCEPMLSKYNLYPHAGGSILPSQKINNLTDKILWILLKQMEEILLVKLQKKLVLKKMK